MTSCRATGLDLQRPPFTTRVVLQRRWDPRQSRLGDSYGSGTLTVLVSDAGGKAGEEERPETDWPRHSYRGSQPDRQPSAAFAAQAPSHRLLQVGDAQGRSTGASAPTSRITNCPTRSTVHWIAQRGFPKLPTRLKKLDPKTQEQLINWGLCSLRCGTAQTFGAGPRTAAGISISPIRGLRGPNVAKRKQRTTSRGRKPKSTVGTPRREPEAAVSGNASPAGAAPEGTRAEPAPAGEKPGDCAICKWQAEAILDFARNWSSTSY